MDLESVRAGRGTGMSASKVRVVYDGVCPLCRACVRRLRSRSAQVRFTLIDARTDPAECRELALRGFDLNDGIAMQANEQRYSGAAAAHPALTQESTA